MSNCALTVPVTINVINGNLGDLNSVILNVDTTVCQGDCFEVESISSKTIEYPQYSTIPTSTPLTIGTSQSAVQMAFVPSTVINTPLIQQGSIDQICLDITHTEVGALDLELESPAGTIFELSSGNGGQGNNYTSTCFTASSNTTIQSGSPPYTGNYIPEAGSLANAFVGESVSGLWKLHINNNSSVNAGVLNNWSIKFVSIITSEVTADSLSWWSVNGLSDTTIASPILCPNQSGQYVLTSCNEYGCWGSSDTLNVLMNPAPNSGIDTTIVIDVYNGPFNLFSYLSSTANLNLGAFYDTLYSSYMLPVVNPDTLENPSTFLYITENTLHCTDTAALTVNIVGYCVTPPNPPNPNIAPLPNAGNDVNINLGISQGTVSLFWYLDSGVPTTGNWFDSLGNAILAAVDLSTVQTTSVYTYILANANGCLDTSYLTLTVVDDLSFDNYELTSLVSLDPNPTNGEVLVKSEISELVNIRIYNQFGQLVKEVNGVNKTERISLESLASGLYYFKVTNLSGTFHFAEKIQLLRF